MVILTPKIDRSGTMRTVMRIEMTWKHNWDIWVKENGEETCIYGLGMARFSITMSESSLESFGMALSSPVSPVNAWYCKCNASPLWMFSTVYRKSVKYRQPPGAWRTNLKINHGRSVLYANEVHQQKIPLIKTSRSGQLWCEICHSKSFFFFDRWRNRVLLGFLRLV